MKTNDQLLQNVIGQINGIKKMLEDDRECEDVMIQIKAIKAAINRVANNLLEEYLEKCVKSNCSEMDKDKIVKLFKEIVNNN